jgi:O-antigen/teichoic acid export membrane protein
MGMVVGIIALTNSLPRLILGQFLEDSSVAIFANTTTILLVMTTLTNSLGQFYITDLSRLFMQGSLWPFCRLIAFQLLCVACIGGGILLLTLEHAAPLMNFLINDNGSQYHDFLFMVVISGIAQSCTFVLGFAITSTRWFKSHALLHFAVLLMSLPMQYWGITQYGLMGAAYALLLVSLVQMLTAGSLICYFWLKTHTEETHVQGKLSI